MKTAQEWYVHLLGRPDMGWNVDMTQQEYHDHIKEVQLDAMKEGMRRAAGLCDEEFFEHNECRKDIISAADALAITDL